MDEETPLIKRNPALFWKCFLESIAKAHKDYGGITEITGGYTLTAPIELQPTKSLESLEPSAVVSHRK